MDRDSFALEIDPELSLSLEITTPGSTSTTPVIAASQTAVPGPTDPPLVEVLGPDVALPALLKWVPDQSLRQRASELARQAMAVEVVGPDGMAAADEALGQLRDIQKAIEAHFDQPVRIAHHAHRRLTALRGEWIAAADEALRVVGHRLFQEKRRLEAIAAEERRKAQEDADRRAREAAAAEAQAAAAAEAPPEIVQALFEQAKAAMAPPVVTPPSPKLKNTTTKTTWKARTSATTADRESNPDIASMSPTEQQCVLELLRAIVDGCAPLQAITVNWSYLNARAKADKGAFDVPGFVAFEVPIVSARGGRRS